MRKIHLHLALASLVILSILTGDAISQTTRDHRSTTESRQTTRDHRSSQGDQITRNQRASKVLNGREVDAFQRRIRFFEQRAAFLESERQRLKTDASSLYGSMQKQIISNSGINQFGGTLGAKEGTGFVTCTQACETEYSKCGGSFLCDIQGAKCLLECAVD